MPGYTGEGKSRQSSESNQRRLCLRDKNECGSWNTEGVWVGVARREGTGWAVGTVNKRGNRCVGG